MLDRRDTLGSFLPQYRLVHVDTLQQNGNCHVHLNSLFVEDGRHAILQQLQPSIDGSLYRHRQCGAVLRRQRVRIEVHGLFYELILTAAMVGFVPVLQLFCRFRFHPEIQSIFVFTHNSSKSS